MHTEPHQQRAHSELAPSKASTWTTCTASVGLVRRNADRLQETPSKYAEEGTLAHEVAEAMLLGKKLPANATKAMLDYGNAHKRLCLSYGPIQKSGVERSVPLFYHPNDRGHVDYLLIDAEKKRVVVIDYKYGQGVLVTAEHNKQMAIYALSAIVDTPTINGTWIVEMVIHQPRSRDAEDGDGITKWILSGDDLYEFCMAQILPAAKAILGEDEAELKYAPSESACRWCPAKGLCSARNEWLMGGSPALPWGQPKAKLAVDTLTDLQVLDVLTIAPDIRGWLDDVEEYATQRGNNGSMIPGTKFVAGRGSRRWKNPNAVAFQMELIVGLDIEKRDVLSPHAVETLAKESGLSADERKHIKEWINRLSDRVEGQPKLVLATDKRPALEQVTPESEFTNLALAGIGADRPMLD